MTMNLPEPIADFIEANALLDIDGMMKTFLHDAVFTDNGKDYTGQANIRQQLEKEAIAVKAIFEPDTVREEDGDVVLEGPVHGEFPGSPLRFNYRFTLADDADAIRMLEIAVWA